jgi:hypothetical protein
MVTKLDLRYATYYNQFIIINTTRAAPYHPVTEKSGGENHQARTPLPCPPPERDETKCRSESLVGRIARVVCPDINICRFQPNFYNNKKPPKLASPSPLLSLSTNSLVLRFHPVLLFDAIWCEVQKSRADALRLIVRMGDPYDSFEGSIGIVDLVHKRVLYHRGQCGVKSGCRFLQIPE